MFTLSIVLMVSWVYPMSELINCITEICAAYSRSMILQYRFLFFKDQILYSVG